MKKIFTLIPSAIFSFSSSLCKCSAACDCCEHEMLDFFYMECLILLRIGFLWIMLSCLCSLYICNHLIPMFFFKLNIYSYFFDLMVISDFSDLFSSIRTSLLSGFPSHIWDTSAHLPKVRQCDVLLRLRDGLWQRWNLAQENAGSKWMS